MWHQNSSRACQQTKNVLFRQFIYMQSSIFWPQPQDLKIQRILKKRQTVQEIFETINGTLSTTQCHLVERPSRWRALVLAAVLPPTQLPKSGSVLHLRLCPYCIGNKAIPNTNTSRPKDKWLQGCQQSYC